jgi:hypothetical protein
VRDLKLPLLGDIREVDEKAVTASRHKLSSMDYDFQMPAASGERGEGLEDSFEEFYDHDSLHSLDHLHRLVQKPWSRPKWRIVSKLLLLPTPSPYSKILGH